MVVLTAIFPARFEALDEIFKVEPQLKPYQPNQRIETPRAIRVVLCPVTWLALPVMGSNRPCMPIRKFIKNDSSVAVACGMDALCSE